MLHIFNPVFFFLLKYHLPNLIEYKIVLMRITDLWLWSNKVQKSIQSHVPLVSFVDGSSMSRRERSGYMYKLQYNSQLGQWIRTGSQVTGLKVPPSTQVPSILWPLVGWPLSLSQEQIFCALFSTHTPPRVYSSNRPLSCHLTSLCHQLSDKVTGTFQYGQIDHLGIHFSLPSQVTDRSNTYVGGKDQSLLRVGDKERISRNVFHTLQYFVLVDSSKTLSFILCFFYSESNLRDY